MTITLEIGPEIEAEIARQAAAHGLGIGAYVATLLEGATPAASSQRREAPAAQNMVELFAPLKGLNLDFERDRDTGSDVAL